MSGCFRLAALAKQAETPGSGGLERVRRYVRTKLGRKTEGRKADRDDHDFVHRSDAADRSTDPHPDAESSRDDCGFVDKVEWVPGP